MSFPTLHRDVSRVSPSRSRLRWPLLVVPILLGLRLGAPATASVAFMLLPLYALTGRTQAIQALALSWLFSLLSHGIAPEVPMAAIGRYAVFAAAAVSVLLRAGNGVSTGGASVKRLVLLTVLLGTGMLVHALLFSAVRDVSVLKAVSWTVVTATLLSAWSGLNPEARQRLERQLFGGLTLLLLASVPLLASGLGYMVNGTGFQGVLAHPQAFGPTMALLAAWLGSSIVGRRNPQWWQLGLFLLCLVLIVMSEARTAGLGLLLGLLVAAATGRVLAKRPLRKFLPGLGNRRVQLAIGLGLLAMVAAGPFLGAQLGAYVAKRGGSSNVMEAYDRSRGSKVDEMWGNIVEHPLRGIGFGVASDPFDMDVARDPLLGLPTGASVEKGVAFLAVWEELGLLGLLAVLGWLWMLVRHAARGGMTSLAVCLTVLFMNFGEATLFSPSGMGMLSLVLLAWAATAQRATTKVGHV